MKYEADIGEKFCDHSQGEEERERERERENASRLMLVSHHQDN